ncbi:alpha/beta hydrolase [Rhizobium rosettiformans]|uniref:alpha/beta hydrolase n=1 Tax=Rhizobium rosettiformans TaxID=1368430 RepID=UPI002864C134|nr:dienelactone hydrolase family protein [Rhizobium rosettiformans]MDR7031197.1 phospholipase/carboxylesterase [Rhizobium rosettiformans]MDR7067063.1 phospholipase/carboxylesterase [Rhizobium rosettiformans]
MLTLPALHGSGRDETDLMDFCHRLAPGSNIATPRGPFVQADGFTFFKRRSDRSIDVAEVLYLARRWIALDFAAYVPPSDEVVLVGYSSGAIFAEALLSVAPDEFSGAILMRPQPLSSDFNFPRLTKTPILIIAGKHDDRRDPDDAAILAEQLANAEACVSLNLLDAGHDWAPDDADIVLARSWRSAIATN